MFYNVQEPAAIGLHYGIEDHQRCLNYFLGFFYFIDSHPWFQM